MRYDVTLRIRYEYDEPVTSGRQVLRLMPATVSGTQRLVSGVLSIEPRPEERREGLDFWNNAVVSVVHRSPQTRLEYSVRAHVERLPRTPALPVTTLEQLPNAIEAHRGLDPEAPHHYRGPSTRVPLAEGTTSYARGLIEEARTVVEAVEVVGRGLHGDMRFDTRATDVDTPVEEAFRRRHGVCQDFTQVMIACLRGVGIPAGYVSGYLRTIPPEGKARLEGADAMHAWVMAWCGPEEGWVEFDPTNAVRVSTDHIVVAHGRDYADIAPIKGVLRTSGSQKTTQAVDVVPVTDLDTGVRPHSQGDSGP